MHLEGSLLAASLLWIGWPLMGGCIALAVIKAPWRAVMAQTSRTHLIAGGTTACLLLWLLNIRLLDGSMLHLLGMTTLLLVVGWCFAIIGGAVALGGFYAVQGLAWDALPVSFVSVVVLPATVSWLFARALHRPALRHPFVYFLGAGFLGGALVIAAVALWVYLVLGLSGHTDWQQGMVNNWPLLPLLMFSEGFMNGMCVSALAIFRPDWLKTFDDHFYLS